MDKLFELLEETSVYPDDLDWDFETLIEEKSAMETDYVYCK